ncbi:MAG TPA: FAD binding domain-containing protein [Pseudolabrys sp.]|nr:FAD binding domain-containing protein [Pseudolabrys sp.]
MKAAPFEYSRPSDVDEACALLAADDNARVIAGGQTLVPMMAMRLARPARLVDIARISDLSYVREEDGHVAIGATTRQCVAERNATIRDKLPLVARALPWIGHAATRARGTVGGSIANGDPAAELPLMAVTLEATLAYRADGATEEMPAAEFYLGPTITSLPAGAVLTGVRFPVWGGQAGSSFHEVNARASDFAFASAAVQLVLDDDGSCARIAIGIGAVTDMPVKLEAAEAQLTGTMLDEAAVRDALRAALAELEPMEDLHASAEYRRRTALALAVRAVTDAKVNAQGRA